jgi:SOS-response transcriptional repressor LexA
MAKGRPPKERTISDAQVLGFIRSHTKKTLRPPTLRQICDNFGWASEFAASRHVARLRLSGHLENSVDCMPTGIKFVESSH